MEPTRKPSIPARVASLAYGFRWALLVLAVLCVGTGVRLFFRSGVPSTQVGVLVLVPFFLSQWFFLGPRQGWTIRLTGTGRPMILAIVSAAAAVTVISLGILFALLEVPDWYYRLEDGAKVSAETIWAGIGLIWVFWTVAFYLFWRQGDHYTQLARMARRIIAGSILDLIVSSLTYALVEDRHNCACARGSFVGFWFGIGALLWSFGPGLALLFLYKRHLRLMTAAGICSACGYDLRGTLAAGRLECPECGAASNARQPA